jgi:hypothetical protein
VRYLAPFVLGHRLKSENIIRDILAGVKVPVENWDDKEK